MTRRFILFAAALIALGGIASARQEGDPVVGRTDPAKYRYFPSHMGAGSHYFQGLLVKEQGIYESNFLWVHRARIPPRSGIGLHTQRGMEDMFWVFNAPAEHTVNEATALLPAGMSVLCPLGSHHGIFNPSHTDTLEFINIAVSLTRDGDLGIVDLGDSLTTRQVTSPAPFRWNRLDTTLLADIPAPHGGSGTVGYRRLWDPENFGTPWHAVDHYRLRPGATIGTHTAEEYEEIWYVVSGSGEITVNGHRIAVEPHTAVPATLDDDISIAAGDEMMEVFVMRVGGQRPD
jgi:mannose-6-phosphate isomerase-like protein (cupin superfamily)